MQFCILRLYVQCFCLQTLGNDTNEGRNMSGYTVKNLDNKLSFIVTLNRQSLTLHIPQKLCCLPCAVSTAWTAFMRRRQLVSTYSMNTKSSLSAVFTTRRNLLAIKAYSHCTVSLCSMTPFIPSTYNITCPSAVNKIMLALLYRDQAVGTSGWCRYNTKS